MYHYSKPFAVLFSATLLGLCSMNASAVMIDDFGPEDGSVSVDSNGSASANVFLDAQSGTQILGGERDMYANVSGQDPLQVTGDVASGHLIVTSTGSQTNTGSVGIDYDGDEDSIYTNFSNQFDLSAGGADRFLIDVVEVSGNLALYLLADDANGYGFEHTLNITSSGIQQVLFSSMTAVNPSGTLDWSKVGRVNLTLMNATTDSMIEIDSFCTGSQTATGAVSCVTNNVPEPATLALLAAGLLGLGGRRRTA